MKIVEVELTDEVYEALRQEAETRRVTVGDVVRDRLVEKPPLQRPKITPVHLGVPKIPVSEWREVANEGRAL